MIWIARIVDYEPLDAKRRRLEISAPRVGCSFTGSARQIDTSAFPCRQSEPCLRFADNSQDKLLVVSVDAVLGYAYPQMVSFDRAAACKAGKRSLGQDDDPDLLFSVDTMKDCAQSLTPDRGAKSLTAAPFVGTNTSASSEALLTYNWSGAYSGMPAALPPLKWSALQKRELQSIVRRRHEQASRVQRARIVLWAAEGRPNRRIGRALGLDARPVGTWRKRFESGGVEALRDRVRSGRPRRMSAAPRRRICEMACRQPLGRLSRWSISSLARLDLCSGRVRAEVRDHRRSETFLRFRDVRGWKHPGKQLPVALDHLTSHNNKAAQAGLKAHPTVKFHCTPTHASWRNLIECFFSILARQGLQPAVSRSGVEWERFWKRVGRQYHERCGPFTGAQGPKQLRRIIQLTEERHSNYVDSLSNHTLAPLFPPLDTPKAAHDSMYL